jgi:hypothetical protein
MQTTGMLRALRAPITRGCGQQRQHCDPTAPARGRTLLHSDLTVGLTIQRRRDTCCGGRPKGNLVFADNGWRR